MKRKITKMLTGVMTAALLFGYGTAGTVFAAEEDVTPASLAEGAIEKLQEVDSYASEIGFVMDIGIGIEVEGETFNMGVLADMGLDMEMTLDPEAAHMAGQFSMATSMGDEDGEAETNAMETYFVKEDDGYATYSYSQEDDLWTREVSDADDSDDNEQTWESVNAIFQGIADGAMEAELTGEDTYNGEDVYVMTVLLSGEYLENTMNVGMGGEDSSLFGSDIDMDDLATPAMIMIYKESGLPALVSIDMSEIGAAMMESAMGLTEEDLEEITFEVTIGDFGMDIAFFDYGAIGEITVPDEIKAAAVDADELEE